MKKIMIIDDDAETLDLLTRLLHKKFQVASVSDTTDLQHRLNEYKPDLIIIDHFIGCKTSKEIIDDFKKQDVLQHIPVIIHSGHEQIEQIAMASEASGFIRKPSSIHEIRSYIERWLIGYATEEGSGASGATA